MNPIKKILLISSLILLPLILSAQKESVRISDLPKKRVTLSSGESTIVVNKLSEGLSSKDAEFLFRDSRFTDINLFPEENTKYNSLEEAAYDINRLIEFMDTDKNAEKQKRNSSLGYRATQVERMKARREKEVKSLADSLLLKGDTQKATELYEKFGKQPTYFLNGMQIDHSYIEYLFPDEILSREVKVVNTVSGNPNGEIWYKVPNKVLVEIGLIKFDASGTPYIVGEEKKVDEAKEALNFINIGKKPKAID